MKKIKMLGVMVGVAAAVMTATSAMAADTVTLRFANVTNQPSKDAAQVFMDVASKESGGRLIIKHFPDNMLGDDRVVTESTILGDIDMVQTMPSVLASMIPDLYVWDAPFLFNTMDEAWKCMDSELGLSINTQSEKKGLKYLAALENGFRHYTNNKVPVKVPADVKGQKLRVMETEIQIALWRTYGANPTPMAFTEVISALQQGTIDAQENPLSIIDSNKLYEVQHYISLTGHVFSPHCLYINQARFDSLEPDLQQALLKAAAAYQTAQRARATELNALSVQKFKDAGCEVIEVTDAEKDQWRQMAIDGKVYDLVREKMEHPELLDKVLNKEY
ncbi:DctP family TRAP transporter solute-binding subunit [uncultured Succinatimonas sp.]|uniref:DctP family TRAP transporter solute-binding subunit n=1 Tax=uncultured Succinatimonas sp. TaxID=1262973 RepID=UPI0025E32C06|nr:DctP family TRAP transporter solute-binding subunit [uncultured Succinatimonas sp.]